MFKIYLAVAHEGLEKFLKSNRSLLEKKLETDVDFVGTAVYREGIIQGIKDYHPDVIIVREGIPGSLSLTDLVYQIKIMSPTTRIIFLAGDRKPGDAFLATLVQYGVYDLLIGNKVNAKDMLKKIVYPNKLADVVELMPKVSVNETTNKQIYEAPDLGLLRAPMDEDNSSLIQPLTQVPIDEPLVNTPITPIIETPTNTNIETVSPISVENPQPITELEQTKNIDLNVQKPELVKPIQQKQNPLVLPIEKPEIKVEPVQLNIEKPVITEQPITQTLEPVVVTPINIDVQKEPTQIPTTPIQEVVTPTPIQESIPVVQAPIQEVVPPVPEIIQPIPTVVPPVAQETLPPVEQTPTMQQMGNYEMPYNNNNTIFAPRVNQPMEQQTQKKGLFGKKQQKSFSQQIVTFVGGRSGNGNSQIAFNTALLLAEQNMKVLYLDLNDRFSSIESTLQFGFEDLGIDTMFKDIENGNYPNIINAITSSGKILPEMDKRLATFKTLSKMPAKLEFACFSMEYMYGDIQEVYNPSLLKELNMFLMMNLGYDVIILDAPSDFRNELTKISLIYSNRVFITLTQDYADLDCFVKNMKIVEKAKIGYKDKTNYIVNKYVTHTENEIVNISNTITNYLRYDNFRVLSVPCITADMINATNSNMPALWRAKDKMFKKSIQEIVNLILS